MHPGWYFETTSKHLRFVVFYGWFNKFLRPCVSFLHFSLPSFDTMNHNKLIVFSLNYDVSFIHQHMFDSSIDLKLNDFFFNFNHLHHHCDHNHKTYRLYQLKTSDQSLNHWKQFFEASNCVKTHQKPPIFLPQSKRRTKKIFTYEMYAPTTLLTSHLNELNVEWKEREKNIWTNY